MKAFFIIAGAMDLFWAGLQGSYALGWSGDPQLNSGIICNALVLAGIWQIIWAFDRERLQKNV